MPKLYPGDSCPTCGDDGAKAIMSGVPVRFCDSCHSFWGFWSSLAFLLPTEPCVLVYTGSYWLALVAWLRGPA